MAIPEFKTKEDALHAVEHSRSSELDEETRRHERTLERVNCKHDRAVVLCNAGIYPTYVCYDGTVIYRYQLGACDNSELAELMQKLRPIVGKFSDESDSSKDLADRYDFPKGQEELYKEYTIKPWVRISRYPKDPNWSSILSISYVRREEDQRCRVEITRETNVNKRLVCDIEVNNE